MPQKKNQHYVPQFYMRNFSDDGKKIGIYLLQRREYIANAPIKNQASKDYMYSKDPTMENALGDLEGLSDDTIKKIIADPKMKIEGKDREVLFVFTLLQLGRTLSHTDELQELADKTYKQMFQAEIKLKKEHGVNDKLTSLTDDVWDKLIFQLPNPGILGVGLSAKLIPMCFDLRYKILINTTVIDFITSDNPTSMYDEYLERMGDLSVGLALRGIEIYMPLSPKIAIVYYDTEVYKIGSAHKEYVEIKDTSDIIALNKLVAANAKDTLMYKNSSKNIEYFPQYANLHDYFHNQKRIENFSKRDIEGSILTGTHTKARFFKMKLTILKERPRFAYKNRKDFKFQDRYREIAYHKDEIIKEFEEYLAQKESH